MSNRDQPRREKMEDNLAFHMTTISQAANIAVIGLKSRNIMRQVLSATEQALANPEVVGRRMDLAIFGRSICDYVPLYWIYKTPMQYARTVGDERRIRNEDLVFFVFNVGKLRGLPVVTSDGNAASKETGFYPGWGAWEHLNWKALNFEGPCYEEYKRLKHAEILIEDEVPYHFAQAINVYSVAAKDRLKAEIESSIAVLRQIETRIRDNPNDPVASLGEMISGILRTYDVNGPVDIIVDPGKYFVQ